jgi:hypothetical protein
MPGARGSVIREKSAAIAETWLTSRRCAPRAGEPALRCGSPFWFPRPRGCATAKATAVSRPGFQRGCARTRLYRADAIRPDGKLIASALFRLRPMTDLPAYARSTSFHFNFAGCISVPFVPPVANWQDSQEQLGRSQRPRLPRPRDFVRPRQQNYGRDAPHVAQDKTPEIAVRPASFASLRSQTGRPHYRNHIGLRLRRQAAIRRSSQPHLPLASPARTSALPPKTQNRWLALSRLRRASCPADPAAGHWLRGGLA